MKKREKINLIYDLLAAEYGPQVCALEHATPLQLLVATILSAQCTDKMVNRVTLDLFAKYHTAQDYAQADPAELESIIRRCGYYRAKGANIIGACKRIVSDFGGEVPDTMEVDTHVKRITNLLGIADSDDPVKIESELCANLDPQRWSQFSHLVIVHGRNICKANRPACAQCVLNKICKYGKKHVA